jgi:hypothetical protein
MKEHLGKFDDAGLVFAKEALEAAGIEYDVRDDSPGSRYSQALGRMVEAPTMYDVLVEAEQLADGKLALQRWQKEAEEAALRESGAPPPTAEEREADAEWEREKEREKAERQRYDAGPKRGSSLWTGLIITAAVGALVGWLLMGR